MWLLAPGNRYTLTGKMMRLHGLPSLLATTAAVLLSGSFGAVSMSAQTAPTAIPSPARPAHTMTPKAKLSPAAVQQSAIVSDTRADTPQRFLYKHFDLA